jgi:hypothetical protein
MTIRQSMFLIFTIGIILGIIAIVNKCSAGYSVTITSMIFFVVTILTLKDEK